MKRQEALSYIEDLTNKQLVDFMSEALAGRRGDEGPEAHFVQAHWCLAEASRVLDDNGKNWGEWVISFLAEHTESEYLEGWRDDSPLCQKGTCVDCGFELTGWAKKVTCPICGALTYTT